MRWSGQQLTSENPDALPGLARVSNLVRSVTTPEFAGMRFHEVLAKSALNRVPSQSAMPFGWTINPYRGCSHACVYCLAAETLVLMADGSQKPIWDVRVGDAIIGTRVEGRYRRYVETTVLAHWSTRKAAWRVNLEDGTTIVASGDHRFLTERGWKHVTGAGSGAEVRPHLTTNNALMGFGLHGLGELEAVPVLEAEYRRGYLNGMLRGDGHVGRYSYPREGRRSGEVFRVGLALADRAALMRSKMYLDLEGVPTQTFDFAPGTPTRRAMTGIRASSREAFERVSALEEVPADPKRSWHQGFLAGIFDAEGSNSRGILRIANADPAILMQITQSMDALGVRHILEDARPNGVRTVRVVGGLPERQRFFLLASPAISRKLSIAGSAVKSNARLRVTRIEPLDREEDMFDITTGTGDFIANGVVSHNCFARQTHEYLDLDAGRDFDSEIIVKVNVGEVLRKELSKPSWIHEPVALGTNTDPYQRAEGRYALMPGIITALAESGTPFSILTKGTLLRRDLPLIAKAAALVPVQLAMSIAVFDDELQQSIEPGTPSTKARLETVRAARDLGLDCAVFMMPILPHLTDAPESLEDAVSRVRDAGATSVLYSVLHLRPGAREWFAAWLRREHPELVETYRGLYGDRATAPKEYRREIGRRMAALVRRYGLELTEESDDLRSRSLRATARTPSLSAVGGQPTLF